MPGQHHHSLIHPVDAHTVRQPDHKLIVRHPPEKLHALNSLPREKQKPIRVESAGEIIHHDHRNARPAEMNDKMLTSSIVAIIVRIKEYFGRITA